MLGEERTCAIEDRPVAGSGVLTDPVTQPPRRARRSRRVTLVRMLLTARLSLLAGASVLLTGTAVAQAPTLPKPAPYHRWTLSTINAPVDGAAGLTGTARASLVAPDAWEVAQRSRGAITFRTDSRQCPFRIRFTTGLTSADATEAATAHVTAAVPASTPAYVADTGQRGSAAWRVVRAVGRPVRLQGLQAAPTQLRAPGSTASSRAWLELRVTATAPADADCHAGHHRTAARLIGDALAVDVR